MIKKILFLIFISLSSIWAGDMVKALSACDTFNNMKHSKNVNNLKLSIGKSYRVLDDKKEQYYIKTDDKDIPNRWVNKECFKSSISTSLTSKKIYSSNNELLALSWQNAFCETHRRVKECQKSFFSKTRYTDSAFGLHGLWPQPRSNIYCGVSSTDKKLDKRHQWNRLPKIELSSSTVKELKEVMTGYGSNLHLHEWIKHGTCSNMTADKYYSRAISLTKQINNSKVGKLFKDNIGKKLTLSQVRFKMNNSFGAGSGDRVELRCKNGLITELWLHLGGSGNNIKELLQNGKKVSSRCREGKVDRVGF